MNLEAILGLILGGGGATLAGLVFRFLNERRKGKLESEDTLLARINAQSARDTERVRIAESKVDDAEKEVIKWRSKFFEMEQRVNFYIAHMMGAGVRVPKWPPSDYVNTGDDDE